MAYFNIVAQTTENTVVTEYEFNANRSENYQSEAELEHEFIRMLTEQGYDYLPIHTENDLYRYPFPGASGIRKRKRIAILCQRRSADRTLDRRI